MRFRTLEIRWHDSKPISTCDFQPVSFKKARPAPGETRSYAGQSYRLATGGEDNHVRIWMVHPNIMPQTLNGEDLTGASTSIPQRAPRIEYLATLSRHTAAVNVVRFSPNGELIASAGDDGMIIIWSPTHNPQASAYGSDLNQEDLQYEKEHWKPRTTFRCTTMQVYDLAWSPTSEFLIAGSTDNCARVYASADGKCVQEIAEHTHYVQGVAWDPLNEYIATQSSDRSMHVYRISTKAGSFEARAIGKNARLPHRHTRTPSSTSRPRVFRHESVSDVESVVSEQHDLTGAPPTPAASIGSLPSSKMFPPPSLDASSSRIDSSSRRSSFSAPGSPSTHSRYGRSPSPMPALPAIRPPSVQQASWSSVKLYGDESFSNFFRRLTFSPDGGLLLTPAGQFEDPAVKVASTSAIEEATRGRSMSKFGTATKSVDPTSASSVFIYSRANFARPPVAQLPGHRKASIAVRFSPILYELRPDVEGGVQTKMATLQKETEGKLVLALDAKSLPVSALTPVSRSGSNNSGPSSGISTLIMAPAPRRLATSTPGEVLGSLDVPSSAVPTQLQSPKDRRVPLTPLSQPATPALLPAMPTTGAIFALPYRMMFSVVTQDTLAIYDTQQSSPIALLTKLHYDEFTDMTWSPDGQCLILSARDGYCTLIVFDEIFLAYSVQQQVLQMQSIAHSHSVPLTYMTSNKRPTIERPPTPATSVDGSVAGPDTPLVSGPTDAGAEDRPKKKRRVLLTRVGDINS